MWTSKAPDRDHAARAGSFCFGSAAVNPAYRTVLAGWQSARPGARPRTGKGTHGRSANQSLRYKNNFEL